MPSLDAQLLGPPRFHWQGSAVQPSGLKGRALLTYLTSVGRPVARTELAELLWGSGKLRNLRQELYVLRQLPGAEQWLAVDKDFAHVQAATDLDAVHRGRVHPGLPRRGPFGDGLDGCATQAFDEWLDNARQLAETALREATLISVHERMEAGDDDGARALLAPLLEDSEPGEDAVKAAVGLGLRRPVRQSDEPLSRTAERVLRLAVLDPEPLAVDLVAEVLGLSVVAVAEAYQELEESGRLVDGVPVPTIRTQVRARLAPQTADGLHQALAEGLARRGAPDDRLTRHKRFPSVTPAAADLDQARRWLGGLGPSADPASLPPTVAEPTHRLRALNALGALAATSGDLEQARHLHETALELARSLEHWPAILRLLNSLGANAERGGDLALARELFAEASAIAERIDDGPARAALLYNQAQLDIFAGLPGAARAPSRALLEQGLAGGRVRALGYRVRAELESQVGRFDEAAGWSWRAHEAFESAGDAANAATSRFNHRLARFLASRAHADLVDLRVARDGIAGLGRHDLAAAASVELACCETEADRVRAAVERLPDSSGTRAARLRLALLEGRPAPLDARIPDDRWGPWTMGLIAGADADRREGLLERVREVVEARSEGLLAAQRTAWLRRVQGWVSDPTRW